MSGWTADELNRIGDTGEMPIARTCQGESIRKPVIEWVVRFGTPNMAATMAPRVHREPPARSTMLKLVPSA
jgi:hypothetical protein